MWITLRCDLRPSSTRRLDLRSASDARDTKTAYAVHENARFGPRHENCLRSTRKRPLRGLHEKHEIHKGRLRLGTRKTVTSKESVSPLFDNRLRIGAKIDEQAKLAAG